MPHKELISIAVCTYNGSPYLKNQLDSLLNQSHTNIEIIAVDDQSTDNTLEILNHYSSLDSRIKVFQNENNIGYNLNFEKAIKLCSGEFIAISDQDDIWHPEKLHTLISYLESDSLLIHHSVSIFSDENHLPDLKHIQRAEGIYGSNLKGILLGNTVQGCTILMRNKLKEYLFPFDKNVIYDWWIGVCALNYGKVQYLHQNLMWHRRHEQSAHYSLEALKEKEEHYRATDTAYRFFRDRLVLSNDNKCFLDKLCNYQARLLRVRFSWAVFFFYLKYAYHFYQYKRKKIPYFSILSFSFRSARGLKAFGTK